MWERPTALWRRLKLGREEYLQRLVTTLILDGDAPPWNTPRPPGESGRGFLRLLDEAAHGPGTQGGRTQPPDWFVDEYLLPKVDASAANGWPDWAALWADRAWIIELKTEAGSHRADQLPYYLKLGAAAHPKCSLDLTYITGPLTKPAPALLEGQRYSHLTWEQVLPLIEETWGSDPRPEVAAYVAMVTTLISNLGRLKPSVQREMVLRPLVDRPPSAPTEEPEAAPTVDQTQPQSDVTSLNRELLNMARATATDGRQRAVGVQDPEELEALRHQALAEIRSLAFDDATRYVLPWLWDGTHTGGLALTDEGKEFGFELRFSRYKKVQVTV
jgi:hypothetical protein